jgi:predicted acetyltransferase/RimJ/RimL family protein N-acetyltransferase
MIQDLTFEKATLLHQELLLKWHKETHVQDFWDTSENHIQNMLNYLKGQKNLFDFWIGFHKDIPFALIMTSNVTEDTPEHFKPFLPKIGIGYTLDFMIGDPHFLDKGLASLTLKKFGAFIQKYNPRIRRLFIDPDIQNTKAYHVYEKAGFRTVLRFFPQAGQWQHKEHALMTKDLESTVFLQHATLKDAECIQNMARFYVYDMARFCGYREDWHCPENGLFECFDFKMYLKDPNRFGKLVYVHDTLAGFVLVNFHEINGKTTWSMGEFFILSYYQGKGVAIETALKIFEECKGDWELTVIPENLRALHFWEKIIKIFTNNAYKKVTQIMHEWESPQTRILFKFKSL